MKNSDMVLGLQIQSSCPVIAYYKKFEIMCPEKIIVNSFIVMYGEIRESRVSIYPVLLTMSCPGFPSVGFLTQSIHFLLYFLSNQIFQYRGFGLG
jgi:hypothetical protein